MYSSTNFHINEQTDTPPELLRINYWSFRDAPWSAGSMLIIVVVISLVVSQVAGQLAGVLSFIVVALSAWRLWIPIRFEIGPRGIVEIVLRRRRLIAWRLIVQYKIHHHGVLLFAGDAPFALSIFRSTYIRWGKQREALLATLQYYLVSRS